MEDKKKLATVTDSMVTPSNEDDPEKQLLIETIVLDIKCLQAKVDVSLDQEHKMLCSLEDRIRGVEEAHLASIDSLKDHIKEAIEIAIVSSRMSTTPTATPEVDEEQDQSSTPATMGSIPPPQSRTLRSSRKSKNRLRAFLFRGFTGHRHASNQRNENGPEHQSVVEFGLEEDTYSLMMLSKPCSREWALGILTAFIFQLYLGVLILTTLFQDYRNACNEGCVPYNVPIFAPIEVTLAQGIAIILVLATQTDLLTSLNTLLTLKMKCDYVPWDSLIGEEGNRTWRQWNTRIMFPNVMKFTQGATILFASFVIIVQSRDIIDLLKDFAALLVISHADNIMFILADGGYLGDHLSTRANDVRKNCIQIRNDDEEDSNDSNRDQDGFCNAFTVRSLFFFGSCCVMIGGWAYMVYGQYSGLFLRIRYPECEISGNYTYFGNGFCDDEVPFNTEACGWDDGDCPAQ